MPDLKKGQRIGNFTFDSDLNRGGMAWVLRVSGSSGHVYALKMSQVGISGERDEYNKVAIRNEAEFLSTLHHQRIVRVYPISREYRGKRINEYYAKAHEIPGEPWYFVMEHLSGGTMTAHVKKYGPLTVPEATNIVGNVCLGLYHLYNIKRIAHNDLKPENVLFRSPVRKGKPFDPVLIDFGTAAGTKNYREEAGTLYVMSPERIRVARGLNAPETASTIDPTKAEVWAIGILLYFAMTKQPPFNSHNSRTLTSQILNDHPELIRKKSPKIPEDLEGFILNGCLAKNPADRPDILEILNYLKPYGSGEVAVKADS